MLKDLEFMSAQKWAGMTPKQREDYRKRQESEIEYFKQRILKSQNKYYHVIPTNRNN